MPKSFIFPGQGAQFPGMGKDLYDSNPALFNQADEILGFKLSEIMFNGSADDLKATEVTQPAVFLHSVAAALQAMANGTPAPDMAAGHSLGEFSALAVCGAMTFEDALKLVSIRAKAMQKACLLKPSTMAAVLALPADKIEEICASSTSGIVVPANYNCEGQIVISGETAAVEEACAKMKEAGAKRALVLAVSGAFHSPLMEPAREELAAAIDKTAFSAPFCPVYQNVTSLPSTDPETIKDNLLKQLTSPVRWTQSVRNMLADGADTFIEFGPGTVLQGLVKKISAGQEPPVSILGYQKN